MEYNQLSFPTIKNIANYSSTGVNSPERQYSNTTVINSPVIVQAAALRVRANTHKCITDYHMIQY